jgi:DNA-binding transcriptional LysR family regulator
MWRTIIQRSGLSLERLRVLVEVEEAGSLIRAAGGNDTRAGQYSRQLRELESVPS